MSRIEAPFFTVEAQAESGLIGGRSYKHPHCDYLVLHAPGECVYCDAFPKRQEAWQKAEVSFVGHAERGKKISPAEELRDKDVIHRWPGNRPERRP